MRRFGDAAEQAGDQVASVGDSGEAVSRIGDLFRNAAGMLAAGALAAGVAAGAALIKGVQQAMEKERLNDRLAAQLRATPEEAKRFGALAGKLYADAYGDSLATVNNAVRGVVANIAGMRTASEAELQGVTTAALNLADVFEQDLGAVTRAAGKLVKTGLAKDGAEAMDLLTAAFQSGVDEAG